MASRILLPVCSTLRPFADRIYFQGVYSQILNGHSRFLFSFTDQIVFSNGQGAVACYSSESSKSSKSPAFKTYRPRIGGVIGRVAITQKADGNFVVNKLIYGEETLESRILELLNNMQVEEAVELFKNSSNTGKLPNANIVIQLIQKLAEHGNVETILELQELVLENKLCSEINYAKFLATAYQESGCFEEAFTYLKINFEKNLIYSKIKNQFIFLTIFILRDFPDCHDHVINFVNYLKTRGVSEIEIDLLKCYVLTGKFKTAENFLDKNRTLMKKVPLVVSEILTILRYLQDFCDEEVIWRYFLENGDKFGVKQKLLLIIYEYYLVCLCKKEKYSEVVKNLNRAKSNNIKIHRNNFVLIWRLLQDSDLSDDEMEVAGEIFNWYHEQYSK